ncbi:MULTISPECIES: corrinoid protein [Desulfosporosinus]|uniref:Corrinoid protein n=1 Tax=Desulfosporosinus nitroreducens TaxID=2018668 RepID=A0ABT8R0M2_9FIRM|nr:MULTISPECIES: corrinoid protein [Desulfosporosinus]MDA8223620.1 corrinoid protein [Desulfitobacterium hafniense]MCB8814286.1 corrinoid protein [Desulfosporosinus sp. SRJS8]MCO1600912.1 corrinoid protein [Desulfosporosinus nitroreducens]MCO5385727.1 corrinoid protein [Desulfosporosinus sp.]MDO0825646.1 corrinoid protein [Desulfosporosinus nitroreducens]
MSDFTSLAELVINGNYNGAKDLTQKMIDNGNDPLEIINQGLMAGMNVVGVRFKAGDMYVPEVMMSAKAMSTGIELLKPLIADKDMPTAGKVVIGTVKGDLHDIGKKLVVMMMESAGFEIIDLGVDIDPAAFVKAVKEHSPQVIGLSALLTTTMLSMKDTIEALKEEGLRDSVKVVIGGAPISQSFADEIGADGYAADAASATELCRRIIA